MYIQVKTSNGINLIPAESTLLTARKLFIEGEINSESACEFVRNFMVLAAENRKKPIDVLINSPGGEINAGMLIYDAITTGKVPVRTYCTGRAYSMGAVLFASGTEGRFMLPHSELMIHEPLIANRLGGSASSVRSISESLMDTRNRMNAILAKHTGKTVEEIEEATSFDHYFTPEESVDFGLADKIVGFDAMLEG